MTDNTTAVFTDEVVETTDLLGIKSYHIRRTWANRAEFNRDVARYEGKVRTIDIGYSDMVVLMEPYNPNCPNKPGNWVLKHRDKGPFALREAVDSAVGHLNLIYSEEDRQKFVKIWNILYPDQLAKSENGKVLIEYWVREEFVEIKDLQESE